MNVEKLRNAYGEFITEACEFGDDHTVADVGGLLERHGHRVLDALAATTCDPLSMDEGCPVHASELERENDELSAKHDETLAAAADIAERLAVVTRERNEARRERDELRDALAKIRVHPDTARAYLAAADENDELRERVKRLGARLDKHAEVLLTARQMIGFCNHAQFPLDACRRHHQDPGLWCPACAFDAEVEALSDD